MRLCLPLLCCLSLMAAEPIPAEAAPLNTLTAAEQAAGWKLLFDGTSLAAWASFQNFDTAPAAPPCWQIEEGCLVLKPKVGGGDLVSKEAFANFELRLEWRHPNPRSKTGILFPIVREQKYAFQTLIFCLNDDPWSGSKGWNTAGAAYSLYGSGKDMGRPVGAWNQVRLLRNGTKAEHWLNGEKVLGFDTADPDFAARKAKGGDYQRLPAFGTQGKGQIGLLSHGSEVWFRNIAIRTLP